MRISTIILPLLWAFLAGCGPAAVAPPTASPELVTHTAVPERPTGTPRPSPTASPAPASPTASLEPAPAESVLEVCLPLAGISWDELPQRITNPFNPPRPGSDDPHQGVDIADFLPDTRVAIPGRGVQAVLAGSVSTVLDGRFPFGFGLIVESPISADMAEMLVLPPPYPDLPLPTTLTCPGTPDLSPETGTESLYLMYAHMESLPALQTGQPVTCGQEIGLIGDSGNALNPHLHFEVRVGPSGSVFQGMTHYNPSATSEEMDAYCTWRVSGLFRLTDPGELFRLAELP